MSFGDTLLRTPPPEVTSSSIDITWGEPYSISLFSNFTGPYTPYCYITGETEHLLPEGLTLYDDGTLEGTTTTLFGNKTIDVAVDTGTSIYVYSIPITIVGGPLVLPSSCKATFFSYSLPLPEGVVAPYKWSIISGAPPPGITLNSVTGQLSGTCYINDAYVFEVSVNESSFTCALIVNNIPELAAYPYSENPLTYYLRLPNGIFDAYYEVSLQSVLRNPEPGFVFSLVEGDLGTGLSLDPNSGLISGYYLESIYPVWKSFTIKVENLNGCYCLINGVIVFNEGIAPCAIDEKTFTLNVKGLTVFPTMLHSVCEGERYSAIIHASGGTPQYTFTIASGTLPTGLDLHTSGVISGYANDIPGEYTFNVQVEDSLGVIDTFPISLIINAKPSITTLTLPSAEQNVLYSAIIEGTGTTVDAEYSVAAFRLLPNGLVLNSATGEISGTPLEVGTYRFLIELNNLNGCYDRKYYDLTITGDTSVYTPPTISGTPFDICKTSYYSFMPSVLNGTPPYNFSISGGTLPPGLNIVNTTGEIIGYPTTAGVFSFDIRVTDSVFLTDTLSCSIEVYNSPSITLVTLPTAIWNNPYECLITYSGGVTPFVWSIQEALPEGLVFNTSTGMISGIPFVSGQFLLTVSVRDANNCQNKKQFILDIQGPPRITTTKLPSACQSLYYKQFINVEGGTSPYLWFITSNNLPPDSLKLNPYTGQLSGIPQSYGTFTFSVGIKDVNGMYDQKDYDLLVRPKEECAGNIDPEILPGEPGYIEIERERLISLPSAPVIVKDPFHQKHLIEYLPTPYLEEDK